MVAGDICTPGPGPMRVLEQLWETGLCGSLRNGDRELVVAASQGTDDAEARFALDQIGEKGVRFLAGLPFEKRFSPPGRKDPSDDLLVVHANPYDLEQKLSPEMDDSELRGVIGDTRAAAIAFRPPPRGVYRQLDGLLLCDVAAVGNPKDGDLRSTRMSWMWKIRCGRRRSFGSRIQSKRPLMKFA